MRRLWAPASALRIGGSLVQFFVWSYKDLALTEQFCDRLAVENFLLRGDTAFRDWYSQYKQISVVS
jgi:hypothetical protein